MRSLPYDIDFRARARRTQGWGLGLLAVAGLLWIWFAVLLFTPYENEGYSRECTSRFTSDNLHNDDSRCVEERDWPELMAVLGASLPFAVVGAVLHTSGSVSHRMAEHLAEVTRLNEAKG
ncbi:MULTISPECIES: hypothetical protein [Streptomyces]|uniref:hypothetical protein n=1 Tax=Streptomyces TaxID=1883 RepID=UPI001318A857|nr:MULTISPECIES: hypothetical protein [Streptomyces]QGZ51690.1 hypothetical protein GPZ77_27880 [Streptomyces sp. QHH-9511]GGT97075.1 hypothetical protein GCM10010272_47520 [Streptomyces lateritius]